MSPLKFILQQLCVRPVVGNQKMKKREIGISDTGLRNWETKNLYKPLVIAGVRE